ncbi:MAG TPA: FAD-dependent oxidoreductase [Kofleriaceae bacterium]
MSCLLAACASDSESDLLAGFSPPPPSPDEVQYLSPIVRDILPGEDRIVCSYLDAYIDEDFDIGRIAGYNTTGSHHIILYTTSLSQPPNTHDCKDEEMVFLSLVGGTGGDAAVSAESTLPEGLVRRVKGGSQLVIQTHWLNASDAAIDGQAAFNVRYEPVSPTKTPTDFMAVMNTQFEVTPGASKASVECTFKDEVKVWQLSGHQHDLGEHVRIAFTPKGGSERVLIDDDWNKEWSFNPKFLDFTAAPMVIAPGDKLRVDCDWMNPGDDTVRFPSEMCGAIAQFYPSTSQLVCFNGDWLGG